MQPAPTQWQRLADVFSFGRVVWTIIITFILMLGFDFKTPAAQFKAMGRADSLKTQRIDSVVRALGTRDLVNIGIARYLCFKDPSSARLFLPCATLSSVEFPR